MRAFVATACFSFALVGVVDAARASFYWRKGVRDKVISVCFVGDTLTSRPGRVAQIQEQLREFEWAANIEFQFWGTCPAPTSSGGDDLHDGDFRVVLPNTSVAGTGPIPGNGCPMFLDGSGTYNGDNDGWGSWSNAPNDLTPNRGCLFNLKLGDDPWNADPYLNHLLHEFGHGLGLRHEHERADVDTTICNQTAGTATQGYLTPYDRYSVMHYRRDGGCIEGNYGRSGLSVLDRLGLHILYPEDDLTAEISGRTVIRASERLRLVSTWKQRGAQMSYVAKNFVWKINGSVVGNGTALDIPLPIGTHTLEVRHDDFLNRSYRFTTKVRVLSASDYRSRIVAPIAASVLTTP